MPGRLGALEEAERLVIGLLESAGQAVSELKEIQANDDAKDKSFLRGVLDYYTHLAQVKEIILRELDSLSGTWPPPVRRPGIEQLALCEWEAKVVADHLHDLVG
jgi:hypothetical protein